MSVTSFHSLVVEAVEHDCEDAVRVRLAVPPDAREAFRYLPGQHITVRVVRGERPLRRTYSLVSVPGQGHLEIAVRTHRDGRVSGVLAREVRPGMRLEVLPPAGSFHLPVLPAGSAHVLALAAGTGVTPIFAMVRDLLQRQADARCTVVIGNQTLARTMLREEWLALKDRYPERLSLHFVMSREQQDIEWLNGHVDGAWLERMSGKLFDPAALGAVLLCGPGDFIRGTSEALRALGVPGERIHFERFTLERSARAVPSAQAPQDGRGDAAASGETTQVTVVMDGRKRSFVMARDGTVLLEAAERAGLPLPYSCRDGICSTCRVKVLDGEVALGEQYALEPWELAAGFTLACQARPCSARLTLSYDER